MKPYERLLLAIPLVAVAGAAGYFWSRNPNYEIPSSTPLEQKAAESEKPKVQYPVSSDENSESKSSKRKEASPRDYSGQTIESALSDLIGKDLFESIFNLDEFAGRIVVAVENMTSPTQLSEEHSPLKPLESTFVTTGGKNHASISPDNFKRYTPFVELAKAVDPNKLVAIYVHFYPAFQSAYHELGTDKYFNDRVVEVIDHILKTPEVAGYPRVVRPSPHYRYKFADIELENLSSSQKVLIRMGYDNAQVIKLKLRQLRKLLVQLGKKKLNK